MKNCNPITSMCLNVTDDCNFNCQYCFVKQKPNYMTFQVADDAVKWLLSNKNQNDNFSQYQITFFGGEPTLQWENIIVPLVEKYPKINYSITTNGYLLNTNKIDFLKKHNFSVLLSMDGNKQTQEINRKKNSFDKINSIIPYLIQKLPNSGYRGTIIPKTCQYTFENLNYVQSQGFKQCYFTIDIFNTWTEQNKKDLELELKKFTLAYIDSFVNNKFLINFTPLTNMIITIIKKELGINIESAHCGLGEGYCSIDSKGDIYTCQAIVTNDKYNSIFEIGNIYQGIETQKHKILKEHNSKNFFKENPQCSDCLLNFYCKNNMCITNNYICNQNCIKFSENQCWWNQLLYNNACYIISVLQNLSSFQKYIENILFEGER